MSKIDLEVTRMQLESHIFALEKTLAEMRFRYGDDLHTMRYSDGTPVVAPILCSLINGYVSLTKLPRRRKLW